ncbi:MAG: hypothetical protein ACRYFS_17885 [Janthinobacterium lividum]
MPQPTPMPPKTTLPPFWNWLMRLTAVFALALFLVPTVYVVKYYAVDKPRETEQTKATNPRWPIELAPLQAAYLPLMEERAETGSTEERMAAIHRMGETLRQPYISVKRPLECLTAKATLADLATHASAPSVRMAASDELGKVAQGGAVIRR